MAIDTLNVIAFQTETTRCHAGNGRQDVQVLAGQFAIMVMIAIFFIGAFAKQEMIVAKLELFQLVKILTRDALEVESIDALAVFIPFHSLQRCRARNFRANNLEIRRIGFICDWG